ncbi:hypothetical protein M422DRAFT_40353 [Sphaerobolus stellatus SS14]|nr:hypothetical protein M422DRAFT_40353 [Sphaerobolus stellatus SS14]
MPSFSTSFYALLALAVMVACRPTLHKALKRSNASGSRGLKHGHGHRYSQDDGYVFHDEYEHHYNEHYDYDYEQEQEHEYKRPERAYPCNTNGVFIPAPFIVLGAGSATCSIIPIVDMPAPSLDAASGIIDPSAEVHPVKSIDAGVSPTHEALPDANIAPSSVEALPAAQALPSAPSNVKVLPASSTDPTSSTDAGFSAPSVAFSTEEPIQIFSTDAGASSTQQALSDARFIATSIETLSVHSTHASSSVAQAYSTQEVHPSPSTEKPLPVASTQASVPVSFTEKHLSSPSLSPDTGVVASSTVKALSDAGKFIASSIQAQLVYLTNIDSSVAQATSTQETHFSPSTKVALPAPSIEASVLTPFTKSKAVPSVPCSLSPSSSPSSSPPFSVFISPSTIKALSSIVPSMASDNAAMSSIPSMHTSNDKPATTSSGSGITLSTVKDSITSSPTSDISSSSSTFTPVPTTSPAVSSVGNIFPKGKATPLSVADVVTLTLDSAHSTESVETVVFITSSSVKSLADVIPSMAPNNTAASSISSMHASINKPPTIASSSSSVTLSTVKGSIASSSTTSDVSLGSRTVTLVSSTSSYMVISSVGDNFPKNKVTPLSVADVATITFDSALPTESVETVVFKRESPIEQMCILIQYIRLSSIF